MSVLFVCGSAGSGKSTYIRHKIIEESLNDPERKYLLIVPDQFTMQTQMKMITLHPDHAFSNIEVLSFSRLSHRILEETGGDDIPVLDDTGKSLIIRRVASDAADSLKVMRPRLDRAGFIHEIKSALSEFMQYGISPDDLRAITDMISERRALSLKLGDLEVIYRAFMKYKEGRFITGEETLDLVRTRLHNSALVKDAVIAFDGFTGFTPIQERVIQELMVLAKQVLFSFVTEQGKDPHENVSAEDMFYMSHNSVKRLKVLADQASVPEAEAVTLAHTSGAADLVDITYKPDDLVHLEKTLFRYPALPYAKDVANIHIYKARSIAEEISDTFQRIRALVSTGVYRYRDIAVVVGDMSSYADGISNLASSLKVPVYMDFSRPVLKSPFIEALSSAFDVLRYDYSADSVIRHMRTGFGPLSREETDKLENFLLRTGIRGRSSYEHTWTAGTYSNGDETEAALKIRTDRMNRLNDIRNRVYEHFASLHNTDNTVMSHARALYEFMSAAGMYERLMDMAGMFDASDDPVRALQYEQIYGRVCALLDQIVALCGDETVSAADFVHVFEAGLAEIRLGVIPAESDEIVVGDIVRTRLDDIRVLFLLGVSDCNIPGNISSGGLISDMDREYLSGLDGVVLAPTPREQIFTQRLYLYMNMCKPSDQLVLSYALSDEKGKAMQPSYLISALCKLFPALSPLPSVSTHMVGDAYIPADKTGITDLCARLMREHAAGRTSAEEISCLADVCSVISSHSGQDTLDRISAMSTMHYVHTPLSDKIASVLYGSIIQTSVSRLEKFAGCAYAHFLSYGLRIRERPEFSFESSDMGEVYHRALEEFSSRIRDEGLSWDGMSEEDADKWVDEILDHLMGTYGDTILISNNRNIAMSGRLRRVIKRSVDTVRYQITGGEFVPVFFERMFSSKRNAQTGDREAAYRIIGKIDRMDVCEQDGTKYLRIVDYKSGNKDFDLTALYHGLMMQLSVYMSQAVMILPDAVPAGMLYYHVSDPVIDSEREVSEDESAHRIRRELRMKGVVNSDPHIIGLMDKTLSAGCDSSIVPVGYKKDNTLTAASKTFDSDEFETVLKFAGHKMDELTSRMLAGDVSVRPAAVGRGSKLPCEYCAYASVCDISSGIPGLGAVRYESADRDDILALMKAETGE